jgi:hypothetical protein
MHIRSKQRVLKWERLSMLYAVAAFLPNAVHAVIWNGTDPDSSAIT